MKNFFKNLFAKFKNPRVKIWIISMAVVIVVSVSIMSVIMATNKIHYGKPLMPSLEFVSGIKICNEDGTNYANYEASNPMLERQAETVKEIIKLLNKSGKTNKFIQFFGGQANGDEKINKTSATYSSEEGEIYIRIDFISTPQYEIKLDSYKYTAVTTDSATMTSTSVNSIYIPLGTVKNSFSKHTWYICTGSNNYTSNYTLTTYANYYKLLNYVLDADFE